MGQSKTKKSGVGQSDSWVVRDKTTRKSADKESSGEPIAEASRTSKRVIREGADRYQDALERLAKR